MSHAVRIPWLWLTAAAPRHAKALHVALAIWARAGTLEPGTTIALPLSELAGSFGFHPSQAGRALRALALAGMVTVEHRATNSPLVTIRRIPTSGRR